MIHSNTCDLFISHAWRYHPDWTRMVSLLNAHDVRGWRNFSLPWYDPALDPRTEDGGRRVRWHLEAQIIPAHAALFLAGVWAEPGTRKWLDFELDAARKHGKPVLAVPAWNEDIVPAEIAERVDAVVANWDATEILAVVSQMRGVPIHASVSA